MKRFGKIAQRLSAAMEKVHMRYLHPGVLRQWPQVLTIELTNRCTLACSCCPNGTDADHCRPRHTLSLQQFRQLLGQIDVPFSSVFLHLHGEPFLNSDLPAIISLLRERGIEEFSIFSNAYRIDTTLLDQVLSTAHDSKLNITFSAELYSEEAYERVRCPGRFASAWQSFEAIDRVMQAHGMGYSLNAIIDGQAVEGLKTAVPRLFRQLPQLKDIHFSNAFPWPHLPQTGDLAGHLMPHRPICRQIWQLPVVLASGQLSMCSSDYRGECIVGSLWEHRYSELANNAAARRFRRNIALRHAERNTICAHCLIDRHRPFSRTVKRTFVEKAQPQAIDKYFEHYKKYFDIG